MISKISFQTRARTIDHLGREQIADCPTAISELWKNAYDAYARNASLHVFDAIDGAEKIAAILDDGHGMNRSEFETKWLVVGTDSKITEKETPEKDRNGLPLRPRQGQKGIGRLSSGIMGSFLLFISKRADCDFVAALVDWRLFENPYLMLHDITLPVIEFNKKTELLERLPQMFDAIIDNVWPNSSDKARNDRVMLAWKMFDEIETADGRKELTSKQIASTIIGTVFSEYHFSKWDVWKGLKDRGTALFVSNISFELQGLLEGESFSTDDIDSSSRNNIFRTLSGFFDPFTVPSDNEFNYEVYLWNGENKRPFLDSLTEFKLSDLKNLEHFIDGQIDSNGVFHGKIHAFGEDLGEIELPLGIGRRVIKSGERVGPFEITIGSFEAEPINTTHTSNDFTSIEAQADKYSGVGVYRDSLRVLPYGKPEHDLFGMEEQRSKNAGTFFWAHRKTFGRVAITRDDNPNLRDKAGREGFIDNKARATFKALVFELLRYTANQYFGRNSKIRQEKLPLIQAANKKRSEEEAKKLRKENRTAFRKTLIANKIPLNNAVEELAAAKKEIDSCIAANDGDSLFIVMKSVETYRINRQVLRLPPAPKKLGPLEKEFNEYRNTFLAYSNELDDKYTLICQELDRLKPRPPEEIAVSALRSNAKALHDRLRKWKNQIVEVLDSEKKKIEEKISEENKLYDLKTASLVADLVNERTTLLNVLQELDEKRNILEREYEEFYEPYLRSITKLQQGIDLDSAGLWNSERAEELASELEKFTGLAQLGITVELVSHELERLDHSIGCHLRSLPAVVQQKPSYIAAFNAHQELMGRLKFLSPLKLSSRSNNRTLITGKMITEYLSDFFGNAFSSNKIQFETTDTFKNISFEEYQSRIFPVFINLINNSRYWVSQVDTERKILIDCVDDKIVVADTGPGVSYTDQENLFKIFFTRRMQGRGVGLYLCKTNLAQGGHLIEYAIEEQYKLLSGANFVIEINGVTHV